MDADSRRYTLLGKALPGLLDFCVYCIRYRTEACSSSWIFAYTLLGSGLPGIPEFCVYAAGQGPAWAPGFLRIRCRTGACSSSWIFAYTAGQGLARLLDFRLYCIRCKTEASPSSWTFAYTLLDRSLLEFLNFAYTLQNRSLPKFLDFCVHSWAGASPSS